MPVALRSAGNGPMQSMAHPVKGPFGTSKCMGCVYNQLGRNRIHNGQLLVYVSVHADPPEIVPYHVHCAADTLAALTIVEFYNYKRC